MKHDSVYIQQILDSIGKIETFVNGMKFETFLNDAKTQSIDIPALKKELLSASL